MQYFISDLHFSQRNILKSLTVWDHADIETLRDFNSVDQMNDTIISNINNTVNNNDELYILGDLYFGNSIMELQSLISRIKCKNLFLILGNHDDIITSNREHFKMFFKEICEYKEVRFKFPLPGIDPNRERWMGRVHLVLCHYAMRVWNQSHRGSIMLYGHSHSSLDTLKHTNIIANNVNSYYSTHKTMDVGIDNIKRIFNEYRPISLTEILKIMDNKNILYIDHHEKS